MRIFKKAFTIFFVMLIFFSLFVSCEAKDNEPSTKEIDPNWPLSISDIKIDERPVGVVSLSLSLTNAMYEAGLIDMIAGRPSYGSFQTEVEVIQECGTNINPDIDAIKKTKAKYVLTTSSMQKMYSEELLKNDIRVIVLKDPTNIDELVDNYKEIFKLGYGNIDGVKYGEAYENMIMNSLNKIKENCVPASEEKPKAALMAGMEDIILPNGILDTSIFEILNLENVAGLNMNYGIEELKKDNPDILFLTNDIDINVTLKKDSVKNLKAVKEGRAYPFDSNIFVLMTNDMLEEIHLLAKMVYGDKFDVPFEELRVDLDYEMMNSKKPKLDEDSKNDTNSDIEPSTSISEDEKTTSDEVEESKDKDIYEKSLKERIKENEEKEK